MYHVKEFQPYSVGNREMLEDLGQLIDKNRFMQLVCHCDEGWIGEDRE